MKLQSNFSALSLGITQAKIVHQQQEESLVPTSISSGLIRGVYLNSGSSGAFSKLPWLISIGFILSLVFYLLYRLRVVPSTPLLSILAIFIFFFIVPSSTQLVHRSYANCKVLNPLLDFRLYWTVASNGMLQAAMQAPTQGYLAFGVSQSTKTGSLMDSGGKGSDMAIGYLGEDCPTEGCIFDYWSTEHVLPVKDATQNVTLVCAHRNAAVLTIEFDRAMKTRGAVVDQDVSIPMQGEAMVIYALSDHVPSKKGKQLAYHGMNRGGVLIDFSMPSSCDRVFRNERVQLTLSLPFSSFDTTTFLTRLAVALKVGPERFSVVSVDDPTFSCVDCTLTEFRMPNVAITPAMGDTSYLCVDFEFPVDKRLHAIRFDPIIASESAPVVHHLVLYTTIKPVGRTGVYECDDMPENSLPIFGWAIGGSSFLAPEDVGFLVASPYAALQIHYSNPSLGSWVDRSGVRIHLTPTLRPHNAAWSAVGQYVQQIKLAPGIAYPNKHLTVSGSCRGRELDDWTANGDLHVFAYRMHAHLLGRKVVTQQWRNGKMIAELINDPYSFHYQHTVIGQWTIKRGDMLNTTCWYDTTSRTATTRGGLGSEDEMCIAQLAYWAEDPTPERWGGRACINIRLDNS